MPDIPNTRFINFVDSPAAIQYSQFGEAQVPLDPHTGGILDVMEYRQVSIFVGSSSAPTCEMVMGKISGATLAMGYVWALDPTIHTFQVIGPQMVLALKGGPPNSSEKVQLWVYLRS